VPDRSLRSGQTGHLAAPDGRAAKPRQTVISYISLTWPLIEVATLFAIAPPGGRSLVRVVCSCVVAALVVATVWPSLQIHDGTIRTRRKWLVGTKSIAIGLISDVVTSSHKNDWTPRGHYGVRLLLVDGRKVDLIETSTTNHDRAERWRTFVMQQLTSMGWSPVTRTSPPMNTDGIEGDPIEAIRSARRAVVGPWVIKAGVRDDGFAAMTYMAATREVVRIGPVQPDLKAAIADACEEIHRLR
jgi:hypothetical protein